jgi:hypothetical protein
MPEAGKEEVVRFLCPFDGFFVSIQSPVQLGLVDYSGVHYYYKATVFRDCTLGGIWARQK